MFQFWVPPVRRLPSLLWLRIKDELEEFLIERGADGVLTYNWYHRQFKEAACRRSDVNCYFINSMK